MNKMLGINMVEKTNQNKTLTHKKTKTKNKTKENKTELLFREKSHVT